MKVRKLVDSPSQKLVLSLLLFSFLWGTGLKSRFVIAEELGSHSNEQVKRSHGGTFNVDHTQQLKTYYEEAKKRGLPTRFFNELISQNAWIAIKETKSGPHYISGLVSGGTIYIEAAKKPFSEWTSIDFANFYNELFQDRKSVV